MTLSELARLAHVSISTASKAFTMSKEVNEETRELIFSVAKENGCFKKFFNAKYPKYVVALICPEIKSYTYSNLCLEIQELLNSFNCEVCISTSEFSSENAKERLAYYDKYSSVDAVVLIDTDVDMVSEYMVPIVSVGSEVKNPVTTITIGYDEAMKQTVSDFFEHGYRDIIYIGERLSVIKNSIFKDISKTMLKTAESESIFLIDERFEQGGYTAAKAIFNSRNGKFPKVAICAYDNMAFGVMRFLNEQGINVPIDVKVIGMDNILTDNYYSPRLSSIDPMNKKVAEVVSKSVFEILNGKTEQNEYRFIPDLIYRDSSNYDIKSE